MNNMVGKGRNGGALCEVVSPRPQIVFGLWLCEAAAGPLFTQRLCAEITTELQHNRDLSPILLRMKTDKRATGRIYP